MKKNNFLIKFWNGDISLPIMWWVFGVLGSLLLRFICVYVGEIIDGSDGAIKLLLFLWIPYLSLVFVCIWKSADKFKGNKKWIPISKGLISISYLGLFLYLVVFLLLINE